MNNISILLLIFLFEYGCGYNITYILWGQKTDSTKIVLDKVPLEKWVEKQSKEFMKKAKLSNQDKLYKEKEVTLLNTHAPDWTVSDWLNSKPLTIDELHGNVVLIRWWTGPTCPYCINSAAALNEFYELYKSEGLQVLGFYHHKSQIPFNKDTIKEYTEKLGFNFPIAIDHDWITLTEWWLRSNQGQWTSVSFLLDRKGIVRYIHSGGQYVKGDGEYEKLKQEIEKLLKVKK